MPTKQERERAFHDIAFAESIRAPLWGYDRITHASLLAFRESLLAEGLAGQRVLEFGSGASAQAFFLAHRGADVTGIDISPAAIEQGRQRAASEHLEDRIEFQVMDAERLDFESAAFDLVCGSAVLHHLDLTLAYPQIARSCVRGAPGSSSRHWATIRPSTPTESGRRACVPRTSIRC